MTRNKHIHTMTKPWENRRKPPTGSCQRTILVRDADDRLKPRVCRKPAKGQLCKSCEAKDKAVSMKFRGVGRAGDGYLPGF